MKLIKSTSTAFSFIVVAPAFMILNFLHSCIFDNRICIQKEKEKFIVVLFFNREFDGIKFQSKRSCTKDFE
jgi:hypothetical protein